MKVLLYCINFSPEQIGIGKYTGEMAVWLSRQGHDVHVVTAPPYYPEWQIAYGYKPRRFFFEDLNGCKVYRCPICVPSKPSALTRVLHLASFAASSFIVVLRQIFWKPDIVFVVEPPLFCAPAALLVARLSGSTAWLHVQDFEVAAFFGLGFAKAGLFKKMAVWFEGWLMRRFDHVSTISNSMLDRIHNLDVLPDNTSLFPNWVNTTDVRPRTTFNGLKKAWGITDNQKIVLYAGNMGKKQGLDQVLQVANILTNSRHDILFLLVGDGVDKENLIQQAQQLSLNNLVFKPVQPSDVFTDLLSLADVHLVIQLRGAADAVMPSKLTGILAAGGAAVITADAETELGRFVENNPGIAVRVEPENVEALLLGITELIDNEDRRRICSKMARQYAEHNLSKDSILCEFESTAKKLNNKKLHKHNN